MPFLRDHYVILGLILIFCSWLLEVNASPSLDSTDDGDFAMKVNLLTDVFNILDYEGQLNGKELRVGGFDLLWNEGPIHLPCPNETELGPIFLGKRKLNINLGAWNDRKEQLEELKCWKKVFPAIK